MNTTDLTFNDLPKVVGELCERIAGMENLLRDTLNRQSEPKENLHVPMTVQEACTYLKMPVSTFYYKIKKDSIPVINVFACSCAIVSSTFISIVTSSTNGWRHHAKLQYLSPMRKKTKRCMPHTVASLILKTGKYGNCNTH